MHPDALQHGDPVLALLAGGQLVLDVPLQLLQLGVGLTLEHLPHVPFDRLVHALVQQERVLAPGSRALVVVPPPRLVDLGVCDDEHVGPKRLVPLVLVVEVEVGLDVVPELVHLGEGETVEDGERVDGFVEVVAVLGVEVSGHEVDGPGSALAHPDLAPHLGLLEVELLLLLLQLDRLDERLLPLHDLALLLLLHALPVPLLPLHLHLLDLLQPLLVPPLLRFQPELLRIDAGDERLLDLLVPHEAFREVSVAEGVHVVGVPRDLALLQPRGELLGHLRRAVRSDLFAVLRFRIRGRRRRRRRLAPRPLFLRLALLLLLLLLLLALLLGSHGA